MTPIEPKEIAGKIKYWNNDIEVKEGITLNEKEQKIFEEYK